MSKNFLFLLAGIAIVMVGVVVWKNSRKAPPPASFTAENQTPPQPKEAILDGVYALAEGSALDWQGRKTLIVGYTDKGTVKVKEGAFTVSGGRVTEGRAVIDMTTIQVGSTGRGNGESGLERHLKSDDFFAVEKFPTAELTIRDVVSAESAAAGFEYTARGEMTIKGIANPVEFPVTMYRQDGNLRADGEVKLDRTRWDIRYGSDKFFDNLANNVIDDIFTVSFHLTATAQ